MPNKIQRKKKKAQKRARVTASFKRRSEAAKRGWITRRKNERLLSKKVLPKKVLPKKKPPKKVTRKNVLPKKVPKKVVSKKVVRKKKVTPKKKKVQSKAAIKRREKAAKVRRELTHPEITSYEKKIRDLERALRRAHEKKEERRRFIEIEEERLRTDKLLIRFLESTPDWEYVRESQILIRINYEMNRRPPNKRQFDAELAGDVADYFDEDDDVDISEVFDVYYGKTP